MGATIHAGSHTLGLLMCGNSGTPAATVAPLLLLLSATADLAWLR